MQLDRSLKLIVIKCYFFSYSSLISSLDGRSVGSDSCQGVMLSNSLCRLTLTPTFEAMCMTLIIPRGRGITPPQLLDAYPNALDPWPTTYSLKW